MVADFMLACEHFSQMMKDIQLKQLAHVYPKRRGGNIQLPYEGNVVAVSSQQQLGELQRLGILLIHRIALAGFDGFHTNIIAHVVEMRLYIASFCCQQFSKECRILHPIQNKGKYLYFQGLTASACEVFALVYRSFCLFLLL